MKFEYSPRTWDVFTNRPDIEEVVKDLNIQLENSIHGSSDSREAYRKLKPTLEKYESYGANDTEPRCFVSDVITRFFNEEFRRLDWD